ncbi:MAG: peptidase M23 [Paracoccaceae bacterium]
MAWVFLTTPIFAESDSATLAREAVQKLDSAHLALSEADRAGDRVAALSQTIRAFEDGLDALRDGLRRAALREAAIKREFDAESEKVSHFLGILLSIQSSSGPVAFLHPSGPLGTARAGMIVSEITPEIQKQADALRANLEEVALLRALQEGAADTLKQSLTAVQRARTDLSKAISNRTELPDRFLADPIQMQALIDSSETLDGFASGLAGIDFNESPIVPVFDFANSRGTLPLPVSGNLLHRFNETDAAGVKRPGLLVATRPQALVTTPWPATLRYSGPLLDYGNVIILEPDAGVLLVLAGLDQVFGTPGQVLAKDTVLGLMGGANPDPDGFFADATASTGSVATESLYIELRLGGKPVDPAPWFAQTKE